MIGHSLGAIGAIEMAACALAIDRGVVPPTANWENPDPECDLDYTPNEARRQADRRRALDGQRLRRLPVRDDPRAAEGAAGGGHLMAQQPESSPRMPTTAAARSSPASASSRRTGSAPTPGGRRPSPGQSGIGRITRFDPSQYPAQLAGEVDGFDATDYLEQRLIVQTDHWTHMALAATQLALDDAKFDPEGKDPYRMSVITASALRRQRVRPEGDREPVGQGPDLRRRLPVDRVVLRGDDRPDRDQVRDEGAVRGRLPGGRRRARGAVALAPEHPAAASTSSSRGGTEAPIGPYALTCQLTNGRLSLGERRRRTPTGRSTSARTATSRARAARS